MAGLLGDSFDDPRSNAIMQLAGGLLSGNFGQGAAAYGATMAGAKDAAMKRDFMSAQMDNYRSEIEARKLATVKDARQQEEFLRFFGGSGSVAPAQPGQIGSGSFGAVALPPGMDAMPQGAGRGGIGGKSLDEIARFSMQTGKDLLPAWKIAQEGFERKPGTFVDSAMGGPREYIGDPTKGLGFAGGRITLMPGAENIAALAGQTADATERAKALYGAAGRVNLRDNPDGTKTPVSELTENPTLQNMLGGMPQRRTGNPMIDAVVQTESGGNPNAVSPAGARGLMQVMPGTNRAPGFGVAPARDDSEGERTRVGQDYLGAMQAKYKDPALAAIAYNWGPGNTDMWLKGGGDFKKLPAETQSYVAQVLTRNGVNGQNAAQPSSVGAAPAYGMTNDQAAAADANKTLRGEGAKAGSVRLMAGYDNARTAADSIASNVEARNSLAGGAFVGAGAETKLAISKSLQSMGFNVAPDKVTNTEYLQSTLGQGILNKAKALGTQPTDNDARIVRTIVGSIGTDPNALVKLLDYQDVMSNRAIGDHNKNYGDAKTRGFDAGFDLTVKPPAAAEKPAGNGKTVVQTGMYGGKKVVKYSDGSTDYAN